MSGRVWNKAWIIGGSTGLGAALVRELAQTGTEVIVSARNAERLSLFCGDFFNATPLPLDVCKLSDCNQAVSMLVTKDKALPDLIILNAAIYTPMDANNLDPLECARMMSVNYQGVVNILSTLFSRKSEDKKVTVATVTSPSGWRGLPGGAGYGPSKAAVINLVESLKTEVEDKGFDLRLVNPGFIKTRLTDKNNFKMPQLMEPEFAAKKTLKGLASGKFDTSFPNPFIIYLKLLRHLPYSIYFWIARKLVKKNETL